MKYDLERGWVSAERAKRELRESWERELRKYVHSAEWVLREQVQDLSQKDEDWVL